MLLTLIWFATVSIPTKFKAEYFLVALPAMRMSAKVAADQEVRQVSTGTLVYTLENNEITFACGSVGVGAALIGEALVI